MEHIESINETINWNHAVYMLGKLTDVIIILVAGEGDARSRLREASPRILRVKPYMLPLACGIRERVEWSYATLKKYHDPKEYALRQTNSPETVFDSTLRRIKNSTGAKVAMKLFGAWMDLSDLCDQHLRK